MSAGKVKLALDVVGDSKSINYSDELGSQKNIKNILYTNTSGQNWWVRFFNNRKSNIGKRCD